MHNENAVTQRNEKLSKTTLPCRAIGRKVVDRRDLATRFLRGERDFACGVATGPRVQGVKRRAEVLQLGSLRSCGALICQYV